MKITTLSVLIFYSATIVFAQEKKTTRNTPWDTLLYKNELSLDISPAFIVMLDDFHSESVALTYRYFFNRSNAFRVGYRSTFQNDDFWNQTESFGYESIPGRTDSVTVFSNESTLDQRYRWHTLHLGYEHRFGKRRVKLVLGIDMVTGLHKWQQTKSFYHYEMTLPFDSSGTSYIVDVSSLYPSYNYLSDNSVIETVEAFMLGFTPVIGLQVHLAKHWSLNASVLYDLYWSHPVSYSPGVPEPDRENSFNAVTEAPVADVSLTFHF